MTARRTEKQRLAYAFNRLADLGLLIGTLSLVVLIIAWQKDWQHAYNWVFPGVMGGTIAVAARVVARRYASTD
ncbi:hypothetical protein CLV47_12325 [Antricoccus suffuscus]|uniref:Uncharacterized protein n=1 Tax=Antricoccus suffuscus TaxID=1629062 RepID=A0A2T0ZEM3_9ACTN|nr:hypothetical protein [Antricoccus suffuscus]PRZ34793.1 hypothetical protein CLV47_12325 [Antricoccus suffuscus]